MASSRSPQIVARFETDAQGNPKFFQDAKKKHYKLVFEIQNAPPNVYAATFELHPTYYDPIRTLTPDDDGKLRLKATSYGDYDLKVRLRTKEGEIQIIDSVAHALKRMRHEMSQNPSIDQAIADIAKH